MTFFKAKCRLGLANPPHRKKEPNIGVEEAPDCILSEEFLAQYPEAKVKEYVFKTPEEITAIDEEFAKEYLNFKNLLNEESGLRIVIGGDDSVTFSSILSTLSKVSPKDLGYLRFDSHGDMNLFSQSPTKNFHGMYMRPLYGDFDISEIESLVPEKLSPGNSVYVGNFDLDPEEYEFFKRVNLPNINHEILREKKTESIEKLKEFFSAFPSYHISFDVDSLDKSVVKATGIPRENGLLLEEAFEILSLVPKGKLKAFDLVEVNPKKEGAEETIKVAKDLLSLITRLN